MGQGAAIVGALFGLGVLLAIGTLVGGLLLRAAIGLYNAMAGGAGSSEAVPEPPIDKAMGITFAAVLANVIVGSVVGLVMAAPMATTSDGAGGGGMIHQLVGLPAGLLVMAGMLSALLPTTFGRAVLVTLCHLLISAVLGGALLAIIGNVLTT